MVRFLTPVALILCLAAPVAADWPHPRGPWTDGRADAEGALQGPHLGLDLAWTSTAGSGYSGVAVADGKVVTLFGTSEGDFVAAFDAQAGQELWRHRLDDPYKGVDGAHDGPLSSPVLSDGTAFVLAPRGRLLALSLKDGSVRWEKQLSKDLGGRKPYFGYTTTPVLAEGVLVVLNGGPEGRSIVGLNPATGAKVWAFGDDKVDYQSPAYLSLAGQPQLVVPSATELLGMKAATGDILWRHPLAEGDRVANANPAAMGKNRFLVDMGGSVVAFEVSQGEQEDKPAFSVREVYRSKTLGGNYAPPVFHEGHMYGFRGKILTCMKADDGERVWRSREPGGDGLLLADGHLVIFGSKGNVVVAEATPEGYQEKARLQALEGSSLTWPSFSDGKVFVRNLENLAAVAVTQEAPKEASKHGLNAAGGSSTLAPWLARMEGADDPKSVVDEFEKAHPKWPLVDGGQVHFLYRGPAQEVAIRGSMLDSSIVEPMEQVPGTDLFYRTFDLEPASRWDYVFQVDFDESVVDPKNPRTAPAFWGPDRSELILKGYGDLGAHLKEPMGARGTLEAFTFPSKILGYDKNIQVWLPPGAQEPNAGPYPLLLVQDGKAWLEKGSMANTLDNLVGSAIAPVVVAFLERHGQWWFEAGGSRTADYGRMLAEELVPALGERYPLADGATSRALLGARHFGLTSAFTALSHPDVFGKAAILSPQLTLGQGDALKALIRARAGSSVSLYLDWNRYGERQVDRGLDTTASARELASLFAANGYTTTGGEVLDSFGWGSWRNRSDRVLKTLFPAPPSPSADAR